MNNQAHRKEEVGPLSTPKKFKGALQLLREALRIYRLRAKLFLGIIAISAVLIFLGTLVPLVGVDPIKAFITAVVLLSTAIFIGLLSVLALLYAIKDNLNIQTIFNKGLNQIKSFLWISLWVFCLSKVWIIVGGLMLGLVLPLFQLGVPGINDFPGLDEIFIGDILGIGYIPEVEKLLLPFGLSLLLIILGIIFFIWFSLAVYILVSEEERGMKTLFRSKQLITGRFWKILWRFLVLGFTMAIINFLFIFPLVWANISQSVINIVSYFLAWLITPFYLIYGFLIYKNLQEIKAEVPYQEPRKRKKVKYVFIGILGLFFGLSIFGMIANFAYRGKDESPYDDSDLWLPKIEIAKQDNVFYYFAPYLSEGEKEILLRYWPEAKERLKINREIYWPSEKGELIDDIIEGREWNEEFVENFLKNNEQVLNDFEKAIKSPYFQDPMLRDPKTFRLDTPLFSLGNIRTIAKLNAIKAVYLFNQDKEEAAFEQSIKIIKLGQLLQDSPRPTLITYLVGRAIKEIGLEKTRIMLPKTKLDLEILKDYILQLEQFKLNEKGLENVWKMEYISLVNTKKEMIDGQIARPNYFYKPNQTQRMFAEHTRIQISDVYKNCGDMQEPKILFLEPSWKEVHLKENFVGRMLFEIVSVALRGVIFRKCQEDFSVSATQLLMAIKAYQAETGKIPTSLDELAPKYIPEIPRDPFDGQPIRFSSEKKIIWSVGEDLIDEGGSVGERWQDMPDPTLKIEF